MKKMIYFETEEQMARFVSGFFAAGGTTPFEAYRRNGVWALEFLN